MRVYSAKTERRAQMFMDAFRRQHRAMPPRGFDPCRYFAAAGAVLRRESYDDGRKR